MAAAVLPGQLIIAAAAVGLVSLLCTAAVVLAAIAVCIVRRLRRLGADRRAQLVLKDLDSHLDDILELPEVAAGLARLHAAVRDEQRKDKA